MGQSNSLKTWSTTLSTRWTTTERESVRLVHFLIIIHDIEVIVAPANIHLQLAQDKLAKNVLLSAQNCSLTGNGAYTGEISADMLMDFNIPYVILGHSERRTLYGEDVDTVGKKVKYAMERGMHVILCIGEKLDERESGKTNEVLFHQLNACKNSIKDWSKVVVAYEPVWAIGTGKVATPE
jgi:triosephosphate isomerase